MKKIISMVIIGVAIVLGALLISKTPIYIRNVANNELPANLISNTITVDGDGKVFATPDTVNVTINVSESAKTTAEAQTNVNKKVLSLQDLLKQSGVKAENIQSTSINVSPEYDYTDGKSILKGYRANHTLSVKITPVEKAAPIIDAVSKIGQVEIQNISYDLEDKTAVFQRAREMAFQKAEQKAKQLSALGKVTLTKPISISESQGYNPQLPIAYAKNTMQAEVASDSSAGQISAGQLEFTITLNVVYGVE